MNVVTSFLTKVFGKKSDKDIKSVLPKITEINEIHKTLQGLSNDDLRHETKKLQSQIIESVSAEKQEIADLKERVEEEENYQERQNYYDRIDNLEEEITNKLKNILDELLPVAFAIVKETATRFFHHSEIEVTATDFDRELAAKKDFLTIKGDKAVYKNSWTAGGSKITWNMIHYDVQLIGGIILHQGKVAEMATGEGKTLVATLPVFLNALSGRGVHLVTVNNYLAKRDAEWMGPIFQFHGLSVDCIDNYKPHSDDRKKAYNSDITYGTNNEFGFDYLRDNMAIHPEELVQRLHNYAIVDEVDSVLIDDARTPLIISGPVPKGDMQLYNEYEPKIRKLFTTQQKLVNQIFNDAKKLIKQGDTKKGGILLLRAFKGLPKNKPIIKFLSEQGMKSLLQKTEDEYLAENAKRMPEITQELYFVIEEKNNSVELTDKGIDLISKDTGDVNFFILPNIGEEIAEIEKNITDLAEKMKQKDALMSDYSIKSERVHTVNQLLKAFSLFEKDDEYVVMDGQVKIVDEQTGRIMDGRRYSDGLHQAIEAKEKVKVEAATQTFATVTLQNYFRMYNKLAGMTGTAETEAAELMDIYKLDVVVIPTNKPIIRDDREDLVFKTKREKYIAVIDEVVSLNSEGRPVLVGTTSVEISELLSSILKRRGLKHNVLNAKLHQREADIVAEAGQAGAITIATNMAGRGTDIKLTPEVLAAGGLAIIGTERHESRRVDRQLRGRAGRQGDPGSSQFFVSLEDDLMRLFGSDRISKVMDSMGLKEGETIQHSMISKSIERAQKKVEENNFGIRKRLLEYDDVMNKQREAIYAKRRNALLGQRLGVELLNTMYDVSESLVYEYHDTSSYQEFSQNLLMHLSIKVPFKEEEFLKEKPEKLIAQLGDIINETYKQKLEVIRMQALPVINDVYKTSSHIYKNIVVPVSDGQKVYNIIVNLEKAFENEAKEVVKAIQKIIILLTIDEIWKEHLRSMDDLKQSVQNATYEQKDPLLIYKLESFELFKQMLDKHNKAVVSVLMKAHIPRENVNVKEASTPKKQDYSKYSESKNDSNQYGAGNSNAAAQTEQKKQETFVRTEKKVGRNDPCPCGSGKKYKNCHGKI